jgi:hypothetical protein
LAVVKETCECTVRKYDIGQLKITVSTVEGSCQPFEDCCPQTNSPLHEGKRGSAEVERPFHTARLDLGAGKKRRGSRAPVARAYGMGAVMANTQTHSLVLHETKPVGRSVFVGM